MKQCNPNAGAFAYAAPIIDGVQAGLTKREWFAGMAMQGMLASEPRFAYGPTDLANLAVKCADAAISELNKEDK